jgi:fatty-acyl-CoA synthase
MFIAELNHPAFNSYDLSSLRTGMSMTEVTVCCAMTETSPVSIQTRADDSPQWRVRSGGRAR